MISRFSLVLSLAALLAPACLAAEPPFSFDPAKVRHGTLLHYVKSNRDGSQPWKLDVYVVGPTRIEVVKYLQGAEDMVVVEADLDPIRGHLAHAFQHNVTAAEERASLSAAVTADGSAAQIKLGNGQGFSLPLGGPPFHFYGFDFLGIGWMLPHLKHPDRAFEVEFADPNRPSGKEGVPFVLTTARFEPAGVETLHGVPCRKYKLTGPFFEGFEGWLWANKENGQLERVESSLRTSTDWDKDFKLELQGAEGIDDYEWEKRKAAIRAELAPVEKAP